VAAAAEEERWAEVFIEEVMRVLSSLTLSALPKANYPISWAFNAPYTFVVS
jgi:hypothetical protein